LTDFYTLFYNANVLHQNSISTIASTSSFGPYNTLAAAASSSIIYTSTSVCIFESNNTFVGLKSFLGQGTIGYQLSATTNAANLATVNLVITTPYLFLEFSIIAFCTLQYTCSNGGFPYYNIVDDFCYDVCPLGTFLNTSSNQC